MGEAGEVRGIGEEAGVAGDAVHEAGGGIVDDAAEGSGHFGVKLRGGDARAEGGGGIEPGLGHAEGKEDLIAGEFVEGLSGDAADHFAQEDEVDVRVNEAFAGGGDGFIDERFFDARFVTGPFGNEVDIGSHTGEVREEHADGDVAFAALEVGEIDGDFVVEAYLALLDEAHHGGGGGDDFGEGGGVEDGVERHGLAGRGEAAIAVRLAVKNFGALPDPGDGSRHFVVFDGEFDDAINIGGTGEAFLRRQVEKGGESQQGFVEHLLEPFGQFFEFAGEHDVLGGDTAGVVGGEVDDDAIPDVGPFRVVFHGLNSDGGGGHEAEGVHEIGEFVFAVEFAVCEGPAGQGIYRRCQFRVVESSHFSSS